MKDSTPRIIQFCHGYQPPFLECARQYAVLFRDTPYKVTTVYLTGKPSDEAVRGSASDEVIFLNYHSKQVRGLKLAAIRRFRQIVADRNVKLCIAHRSKPAYVALLATRLPVICVQHTFNTYKRRLRQWVARLFKRRLCILGVSHAVRDDIRKSLPGWPTEQIETLYNRIDPEAAAKGLLEKDTARRALSLPEDAWIIGNVGRLHPDKDQATLLHGFAQALPQIPKGSLLVIIGTGPREQVLKKLAHELGIAESVRFPGKVPDARRYFKAFDVFALTSDHEPFGMVLLEAMMAGIPIICSNCGGGPEVVGDTGRLFPLGNADALAQEMIAQSREPSDHAKLKLHMRERVESLFTDEIARRCFFALPMTQKILGSCLHSGTDAN
ncbi:MAG: glycosyltransferase [Azonexus sp.]|jgi:glycosyltransferase involved in cell wall biosynthesis|nr:glycosyltransferase [Azonexus sp.]